MKGKTVRGSSRDKAANPIARSDSLSKDKHVPKVMASSASDFRKVLEETK